MLRTVLLIAGTAVLALLLWRLGPSDIVATLHRVGWYFALGLALGGGNQAMRALALRTCVLTPGSIPFRDALAIRLSGEAVQAVTFSGPALSEPTKAWLLTSHGMSLREGFAASFTEYLISSFVTVALAGSGLLYLALHFAPPAAVRRTAIVIVWSCAAFLASAIVAIVRRFYLIGTIVGGLSRAGVLRGRLRPDMDWINRMEDLLFVVLRDSPKRFAAVVASELAAQVFLVVELFLLLKGLGLQTPWIATVVIEASIKVIDVAFVFVPLQLGVSEGTYSVVFETVGLPAAAGFVVAFLRRARSLVIASAGLALLTARTGRRKRDARAAD
jgi:hypothetical protein